MPAISQIILVEDDYTFGLWIIDLIHDHFPNITIKNFGSESEFREFIKNNLNLKDCLFIFDVGLIWEETTRNPTPRPKEVEEHGMSRAGFRCQKLISESPKTSDCPIILYSALDKSDYTQELFSTPINVKFLNKTDITTALPEQLFKLLT